MPTLTPDLCVIGAGSAGLSVAAGAAQLGAPTVLVEAGAMGGDCLNVGCVPSKSFLAAGHAAHAAAGAPIFGVQATAEPRIDAAAVRAHVRSVIEAIAPHDSQERFERLGVTVLRKRARFLDRETVDVDGDRIRARRFVVATGSRPRVPAIPGLDTVPFLTNETIWHGVDLPEHLVILGGGPIGAELAQAHRRLGTAVTLIEAERLLPRDDAELVALVRRHLESDGVKLYEGAVAKAVAADGNGIRVTVEGGGGPFEVRGSHLLLAVGRVPNVDDLGLDAAGIEHGPAGIVVDRHLKTTNRRVFAIGDVTGGHQFTHVASHHASVVVQNALFRLPAKVGTVLPAVTYTDPELGSVGADPETAAAAGAELIRVPFAELDRARAERRTDGLLKLAADRRGRIQGVAICGPDAGEVIATFVLAMQAGLSLKAFTSTVLPYPTLAEVSKRAASAFYAKRLFTPKVRRIVGLLRRFG